MNTAWIRSAFLVVMLGTAMCLDANLGQVAAGKGMPYRYDAAGKADPFEPFISQAREGTPLDGEVQREGAEKAAEVVPVTPLQKVRVSQLTLTSVIMRHGEAVALVRLPGEERGYFVRKGTLVGPFGGWVERIEVDPDEDAFPGRDPRLVVCEPASGSRECRRHLVLHMKGAGFH